MAFNPRTINKELDFANLAKHNDNYADIKTELDAHESSINAHIAAQTAHGSTAAATPGAIMQRDSEGRAKVAAPAAADDIARKAEVDAVQEALDDHIDDADVHLSEADRDKLDGIEAGAEPNQNAFAQVNNVVAASESDTLTIAGGTGITISTNPTTKTVTVTATGEATPGPHGSSHDPDGSDPIPELVALRNEFDALTPASIGAETPAGAQAKVDALAGEGNTKTVAEVAEDVAGVAAQLAEKANKRWFDVKDYGAVGDGVTDDTLAIQTAINSVIAVGGGLVYIPPGVYIVTSIHYGSNLTIQGSGIEVTILKLKDNSNSESVFNCNQEVANICIRDLTIDGNRDNQTVYGHGIRSGTEGGIVGGLFFNLYIKNTGAYGIGLQKGTFKNIRIENITTENTGLDGIDIKNISNNNDIIFCSNITIISPGRDLSQTMQVGIDCRGPVVLNNVIIRGLDGDRIGVRFRLTSVETGIGGGKSSLTNFSIYGNGPASGSTGIVVGDPDVRISNGYIFNADYGVVTEAAAQRVQICNVEVDTVNVNGMQIVAEFTKILGCIIRNSTINGIRVGANNIEIKDTTITGSLQQGIRLLAGLSGISLVGNDLRGNGTAAIRDDGASYTAINNKGWVTEANLVSADVDCSSAGDKLVTITHGLSVTPSLQDIILTPIISANSTYVLDNLGVVSVNGSIITAKVRVLTAQAGAVCKLAAQVRAKI